MPKLTKIWLVACLCLGVLFQAQSALSSETLSAARGLTALLSTALPNANPGTNHLLVLNGAHVRLQSAHIARSAPEVLAELEQSCPGARATDSWSAPTLRWEQDGEGAVLCIKPRLPLSAESLPTLIEDLARTGDTSSVGQLRGAFVRPTAHGAALLTLETVGPLIPEQMFPTKGDAPGSDHPELPRPANARRTLSVALGAQLLLTAYQGRTAPDLDAYERTLRDRHLTIRRDSQKNALAVRSATDAWVVTASEEDKLLVIARLPD